MSAVFDGCLYSEGDPPDFWRAKERTARSPHQCCECGEQIAPGQRYEHACGRADGFFRYSTCIPCRNARDSLCPGGFLHGELWELVADTYGRECIAPKESA